MMLQFHIRLRPLLVVLLCHFLPGRTQAQNTDSIQKEWSIRHASKAPALARFNDAKFGMFIHFGLYAKPAGQWKGEKIPGLAEWIMYHAMIPKADYKALAATFNPNKFNADEWVSYAKQAGMRYIVITTKHHDGFALFDSNVSDFTITKATPFKRDLVDELYRACQKHGLRFGVYYSQIIDWWDGWDGGMIRADRGRNDMKKENPMNTWDPNKTTREAYLTTKSKPQVAELLTKYPDMLELWFDYWYEGQADLYCNRQISYDFYDQVYRLQPQCLVNSRIGSGLGDFSAAGDNEIPVEGKMNYWETPGTLNNTWGYNQYDHDWKSIDELLFWIVEIASKGGNYLLNVGPKPDGTFPTESIEQLKQIGAWMRVNGEAIYGTRKWLVRKEGSLQKTIKGTDMREQQGFKADFTPEDFWFTQKDNHVYALALKPATAGKVVLKTFATRASIPKASQVKAVSVLGVDQSISWKQTERGLEVQMPQNQQFPKGYALKITLR